MAKSSLAAFNAKAGLTLTAPALVSLIGYAILILICLLPLDMYTWSEKDGKYVKQQYSFWYRLVIVLLLLFPFLLSVYSVNCMVVGNCRLWSWILALLTLLWAIVITVTTFSSGSFALDSVAVDLPLV
jgi:hypothetical protein